MKRKSYSNKLKAKVALAAFKGDRTANEIASGNLVEPEKQEGGIVLPSGKVIHGDANSTPPGTDKEF